MKCSGNPITTCPHIRGPQPDIAQRKIEVSRYRCAIMPILSNDIPVKEVSAQTSFHQIFARMSSATSFGAN